MQSESTSFRWLVLAPFTSTPTGRFFSASDQGVKVAMEAADVAISVPVPGIEDNTEVYELRLSNLKSCTLAGVSDSVLASLNQLLEELKAGTCTTEQLAERVASLAGENSELAKRVSGITKAAEAPRKSSASHESGSEKIVDAIFSQVDYTPKVDRVDSTDKAKNAVSAFITAVKKPANKGSVSVLKNAQSAVEEAMLSTAAEILGSDAVTAIESSWRGVKFLVNQCPSATKMHVDCVDTMEEGIDDALINLRSRDWEDLPDAIFVSAPVHNIDRIRELAEFGEELQIPIVVSASPELLGADNAAGVVDQLETPYGGLGQDWQELLAEESTRWLSIAINPVVLFSEGAELNRRVVLGSPVFAVAAMLAASCQATGDCSRILGKPGSLFSPGSWNIVGGRHDGLLVPTEAFYSAATQSKLGQLGILGLGSGRNTDLISLYCAPTLRSCKSALSLSGQIRTGKIVRFAQWVLGQVPEGASDNDVSTLFQEAARVFLFRGATEGITFRATIEGDSESRKVNISVHCSQQRGRSGFQVEFALPLPS